MKKITLLVASILLVVSVANASEVIKTFGEERSDNYSFDEPISFTERGIELLNMIKTNNLILILSTFVIKLSIK